MYSKNGELFGGPARQGPVEWNLNAGVLAGGVPDHLTAAIKREIGGRLAPCESLRTVGSVAEFHHAVLCENIGVAIVPLEWTGGGFLEESRSIGKPVTLVCFADRCDGLSISEYCRAFTSGISYLLDSASADFISSLVQICDSVRGQAGSCGTAESGGMSWARIFEDLGVVGSGPDMARVYEQVGRAALAGDVPALLLGESGTGKQLFAEALHRLDPKRRSHPFIAVNCSTISHALAESDLFGHQKGSFTGASETRKGFFRSSDGGTLFLDEIGDLDLRLQPKLLRVLEQKMVIPVGSDREFPVDVRVVSATNRDLAGMVRLGTFRLDLFERLNVVVVRIPPLRERPCDIEPLIMHMAAKHGRQLTGVDLRVVDALVATGLPGNVRELENIVRRSIIASTATEPRRFRVMDLPVDVLKAVASTVAIPLMVAMTDRGLPHVLLERLLDAKLSFSEALDFCDEALIVEALRRTNGNRSGAARLLRVSERTIFNKIRKHGPKREIRSALAAGDRNHHFVGSEGIRKTNDLSIGQAV